MFKLHSNYKPTGDQPEAIKKIVKNIKSDVKDQVLLGVTGSGKTFTVANIIKETGRPALIMAPNKTLAAQLYSEYKSFFRRMQWNISCHIMIIISLRPIFPLLIHLSKKIHL